MKLFKFIRDYFHIGHNFHEVGYNGKRYCEDCKEYF